MCASLITAYMNWKVFLATFGAIFLAELGDKTQLAAIMMTSKTKSPVAVFLGAVFALSVVTLIGVLLGGTLTRVIPENWIKNIAAVVFIVIGLLILFGIFD